MQGHFLGESRQWIALQLVYERPGPRDLLIGEALSRLVHGHALYHFPRFEQLVEADLGELEVGSEGQDGGHLGRFLDDQPAVGAAAHACHAMSFQLANGFPHRRAAHAISLLQLRLVAEHGADGPAHLDYVLLDGFGDGLGQFALACGAMVREISRRRRLRWHDDCRVSSRFPAAR